MATTYKLFISHSWAYSDAYAKLVKLLKERSYFSWQNFSVPMNDPIHTNGTDSQLRQAIKNKIQPTHCILMLAGVYGSHSKWIKLSLIHI